MAPIHPSVQQIYTSHNTHTKLKKDHREGKLILSRMKDENQDDLLNTIRSVKKSDVSGPIILSSRSKATRAVSPRIQSSLMSINEEVKSNHRLNDLDEKDIHKYLIIDVPVSFNISSNADQKKY